jgi:hypothetical protein
MPYLVFGVAIVIGLVLLVRGFRGLDRRRAMVVLRWLVVVVVAGGIAVFAIERGVGEIIAAAMFLLPVLLRWRGVARWVRNLGGPSPGQSSGVETRFLRMSLDHDSGVLDGIVLVGAFRGRRLAEMSRAELLALLTECRVEDEPSASILEAYLDRVHGDWRGPARDGPRGGAGAGQSERASAGAPWSGGAMSREEAAEILGVLPDASPAEIKAAHHKLMLKVHPDQGGSNYLAAKINQAKDVLLRGRR